MIENKNISAEAANFMSIQRVLTELSSLRLPSKILIQLVLVALMLLGNDVQASTDNDPFVIGGRPVVACEYPHLVSVRTINPEGGIGMCSGSLVDINGDDKFQSVLTAKHCVADAVTQESPGLISVRLGHDQEQGIIIPISSLAAHPVAQGSSIQDDIAVLQLEEPVLKGSSETCVNAPVLARSVDRSEGVVIVGFGKTKIEQSEPSTVAHVADATLITGGNFCTDMYTAQLCIGNPLSPPSNDIHNLSSGDSGSAVLQRGEDGVLQIVGVASVAYTYWAVSIAANTTTPETRQWIEAQINRFDTGETESAPPSTLTTFSTSNEQLFADRTGNVIIRFNASQFPDGNKIEIENIKIVVEAADPCLQVLSVTDALGNTLPHTYPDENSFRVATEIQANRYNDFFKLKVLPKLSELCIPNIHGSRYFTMRGTAKVEYSWQENGEQFTKQQDKIIYNQQNIYRPLFIPFDMADGENTMLHEQLSLNQEIWARREGDDLRIYGKSDLFSSFYIDMGLS